jgi:hypothetical protein
VQSRGVDERVRRVATAAQACATAASAAMVGDALPACPLSISLYAIPHRRRVDFEMTHNRFFVDMLSGHTLTFTVTTSLFVTCSVSATTFISQQNLFSANSRICYPDQYACGIIPLVVVALSRG